MPTVLAVEHGLDRWRRMGCGSTVVQVEMPPGQLPRQLAYIDVGLGTVRFELIGPLADQGLRQWLQDDYDRIIQPAPW